MTREDTTSSDGTLLLSTRRTELRLDGFSIAAIEGPDAGATVPARASELSVGIMPGNDLVLTDPTVSRHHFSVTATRDGFLLRDLGSSNGTWVGAVRLREGFVGDGARVRAGRTILKIDQLDQDICETLSPDDRFGSILGSSSSMRRIFAALPSVARSESTVLLEGETGTGKSVLASAIHEASPRAAGPFVVLDCAAVAPSLVESELFGHARGAFTGAGADRAGVFEQAGRGTIFIDEIGELPLDLQPRLLRALEERSVKRLGDNRRLKIDARVIAATNRDLRAEVNRGTFRADLFYRLNVVRLHVPPLRERTGDIEQLARHFYEELLPGSELPADLVEAFRRQLWPGNVRELRGAVERAVLFQDPVLLALGEEHGAGTRHHGSDASTRFDPRVPFRVAKQRAADIWEESYLGDLMSAAGGNLSEAARLARTDRGHLRMLLRKYGLRGAEAGTTPEPGD